MKWFVVISGRRPGIYDDEDECQKQVKDFPNPHYAVFKSLGEAQLYLERNAGFTEYHIYTNGECKHSRSKKPPVSRAGYGIYFGPGHPNNSSGRVKGEQSNQRAEIYSIYQTMSLCLDIVKIDDRARFCIHTDSEYAINCICHWINKWKQNGWKTTTGNTVLNQDIIIETDLLAGRIRDYGGTVTLLRVRTDCENEYNAMAIELANKGCYMD